MVRFEPALLFQYIDLKTTFQPHLNKRSAFYRDLCEGIQPSQVQFQNIFEGSTIGLNGHWCELEMTSGKIR